MSRSPRNLQTEIASHSALSGRPNGSEGGRFTFLLCLSLDLDALLAGGHTIIAPSLPGFVANTNAFASEDFVSPNCIQVQ
jgi:hypothetical protein